MKIDRSIDPKNIFIGSFFVIVGFWIWLAMFGNPYHEILLVNRGQSAPIKIGECYTDVLEGDGRSSVVEICSYGFIANGQFLEGSGQNINEGDEVKYLPEDPSVHRIKTEIADGYLDLIFCRLPGGFFVLVMFTFPGIAIINSAI